MKYTEIDKFIEKNNLLSSIEKDKSGIYAITIDDGVVYVGQGIDVYKRCSTHIYNIQNAMLNGEHKYLLLLAALLGGHKVDCRIIEYVEPKELTEYEDKYIEEFNPCLNILTPHGKQDISHLKIEDVLTNITYSWDENFGYIKGKPLNLMSIQINEVFKTLQEEPFNSSLLEEDDWMPVYPVIQ